MKSEYENKIDNLEGKVQRLEARIEELLSLKTGPRGPQGPIDVCVTQAVAGTEKVVERQLASLFERVDEYARRESAYRKESIDGVRGELNQHRKEVNDSLSLEGTKTRIENIVVHLFQDYGIVSSHDGKVILAD